MAASLSVNAMQVNFESVLGMEHTGCSVFEGAVIEFFANAQVIAGTIVCFLSNRKMVVTKDVFAEAFGLLSEGMVCFLDLPAQTVAENKMRFFDTDVPFRAPNKNKEMKVENWLLHDIVAKELCAKDSSLDVVTSEKFDLMVTISAGSSVLLAKLVQADLGESVKLHPLKVFNSKSVLTYMKKNMGVDPAGRSTRLLRSRRQWQRRLRRRRRKKEKIVLVKKQVVAGSQAAAEKSTSGTRSYGDSRPLSKLGAAKQSGATPKRKLVMDSSDSESTVSLPLVQITKKQRTRRTKPVKKPAADKTESNPSPVPEISAEADDVSTAAAPEGIVETIELAGEQVVDKEHSTVVRLTSAQAAQQSMNYTGKSVYAPVASMDSKVVSLDTKVDKLMDTQTFTKLDFGIYKRAFYEKMDAVVANVNSSQTTLETILVRQFTEHQLQIAKRFRFFQGVANRVG
ncbi:kinesin-4-like [Dorcoceras hygrometricum]|uniref:Kinesin-4-like n=1 Tax=Dorcoceras hygrometricum TaxID=472368 RepID=A0A2Z7AVB3_9LAMI|nr:kinesin-4-like [Dorcoceras hygrometricum]